MTWFGGLVLGLGVLLVAALGGRKILHMVRRRGGRTAKELSYAERLDLDAETGVGDEIDRLAQALIREHGAGAVIKAARRALADLDEGDARNQAVWQRVLQSAQESDRRQACENEAAK